MADSKTLIVTRIILRAIFPVVKTVILDDHKMKKKFKSVNAKVQFIVKNGSEKTGAVMVFKNGEFTIEQGVLGTSDITFSFKTPEKFKAFFTGRPTIPKIKGIFKVRLLLKIISLLFALKILMPNCCPTAPEKKRLKVKLIIYMITTALSQYNKAGDPDMAAWTEKQPDRVYQISVDNEEDLAAYIRVKAGKTKAGRGVYKRRRPFVHIRFHSVNAAIPIFLNQVDFVQAVSKQLVRVEGSPEYSANLNDFMQRIQALLI